MSEETADRLPLSYVLKSRDFYEARGFSRTYRWAQHDGAPFTPLKRPLTQSRVAVVTTSVPFRGQDDTLLADAPKNSAYAHTCDPVPERMFTTHLSWAKETTHTDDVETFLPLRGLQAAAEAGRIGDLAPRFYGVPTNYSQRETRDDAVTIAKWCEEDAVDVVLLIPL